jgi:hypothetical protein
MSTKEDRAVQRNHRIMPIEVYTRQADGTTRVQKVDVDVRTASVKGRKKERKNEHR